MALSRRAVTERLQLRHGYSSMCKCEVPWFEVSQGADAFALAHVFLRYLAVLPSTQDCGRRPGPGPESPDFVLLIEGVSDALLDSDHNFVAMCAECNPGLGVASIPP